MARSQKLLLFILVIAFILRIGFIIGTRAYINPETVEAGAIAHALYIGKGFSLATPGSTEYYPTAIQAPVFPFLLAGMYLLFGENETAYLALELLQSILSVWLCFLIYRIGTLVFNETTGLIAAGISAVFPVFIIYSGRTTNTIISVTAIGWFIYLLLKFTLSLPTKSHRNGNTCHQFLDSPTPRFGTIVCVGLSAGLAILAEPIILGFIILSLVGFILFQWRNTSIRPILTATFVAVMVFLPWTIRNELVFHKFIPVRTMFGINLWQGNNPQATGTDLLPDGRPMYAITPPEYTQSQIPEPERDAIMVRLAKEFILSHPGTSFRLFLQKCYYFWWFPPGNLVSPTAAKYARLMWFSFFLLLVLVGIGTGFAIFNKYYMAIVLFWLLFINYTIVYGITHFGHFRYRAPIEPFLIILAAYGLVNLIEQKLNRLHKLHKLV